MDNHPTKNASDCHGQRCAIIGPGRLGQTLAQAITEAGKSPVALGGRSPQTFAPFAESLGVEALSALQAVGKAELVILTVRDDAIEEVCKQLAAAGALSHRPVVLHCSGAKDATALDEARQIGCPVGSMHPLQTFPNPQAGLRNLPGTFWFLEGDENAIAAGEQLVLQLGGQPVRLHPGCKAKYHAAAVMCCNYLVTLLDTAEQLYRQCGLSAQQARAAMAPIVHATVDNVLRQGASALTGPVARGDWQTVEKHLQALTGDNSVETLYSVLGKKTLEIAQRESLLSDEQAQIGRTLFAE